MGTFHVFLPGSIYISYKIIKSQAVHVIHVCNMPMFFRINLYVFFASALTLLTFMV